LLGFPLADLGHDSGNPVRWQNCQVAVALVNLAGQVSNLFFDLGDSARISVGFELPADLIPQQLKVIWVQKCLLEFVDQHTNQVRFRDGVLVAVAFAVTDVATADVEALAPAGGPQHVAPAVGTDHEFTKDKLTAIDVRRRATPVALDLYLHAIKNVAANERLMGVGDY
jgi:hypothetical protein